MESGGVGQNPAPNRMLESAWNASVVVKGLVLAKILFYWFPTSAVLYLKH